jgi:hypothetical protein
VVSQQTDPARWLLQEIPGWRDLDNRERKAIRDFPVLWSFFELHATGQNGYPNANPPRICNAVKQLHAVDNHPVIDSARYHFGERYFGGPNAIHAWLALGVGPDYVETVQFGLRDAAANNRHKLLAVLLVTNRLRNNYLHGEKASYGFRGQYQNFRHANSVLMHSIGLWPRP